MPVPEDKVIAVAMEWTKKGDNDLKNAVHTLKMGKECPTDTVCFHAQQCVEKYLKAFLVALGKPFPKTHDIESLIQMIPTNVRIGLSVEEQRRLTEYATFLRYPGPYETIGLSEAKEAVKLAQRIQRKILKMLEKKPLF